LADNEPALHQRIRAGASCDVKSGRAMRYPMGDLPLCCGSLVQPFRDLSRSQVRLSPFLPVTPAGTSASRYRIGGCKHFPALFGEVDEEHGLVYGTVAEPSHLLRSV
jgi:hypothetical protein